MKLHSNSSHLRCIRIKVNHSRSLKSATSLKLKITETVGLFPKVVTIWYNKLYCLPLMMNERKPTDKKGNVNF